MTTTRSGASAASASQPTSGDLAPAGPATSTPPASATISGIQWPPTKGGSSHSRASARGLGAPATAARMAASRSSSSPRSSPARASIPAASPSRGHILQHLPQAARILLQHPRRARQPRCHLDHVLEGDRADVADGLGDDQVRGQLRQPLLVEAVERPTFADHRLDGGVDLAGAKPRGEDGRGQVRQPARRRRVVALVGDADHVGAETEREQHLGR